MRTDAGRGRLYDALQLLHNRWNEVEPHWNDPVRVEFEETIVEPLFLLADEVLRAMDRLTQVFTQARNDCKGTRGMGDLV